MGRYLYRTDQAAAGGGAQDASFVPETRFGFWFLGTETWVTFVVRAALDDLERLIPARKASYPVVLDAGCGQGKALGPLIEHFAPERVIGIDAEDKCLELARAEAARQSVPIELRRGDLAALALPDASVDLVFCHQTLHHLTRQEAALREFHRVLRPGGLLLLAESTRAYIHSWLIRYLFRHPMHLQRSAEEFQSMTRAAGFSFNPQNVSLPYLWWSRPDLGLRQLLGFGVPAQREETLLNLVATKESSQ